MSATPHLLERRPAGATHRIRVEERMTPGAYVVEAELPGVDPEHGLRTSVEDGLLVLRAERVRGPGDIRSPEFRYGAFSRAVRLPAGARPREARAEYRHGVVTVTVPVGPAPAPVRSAAAPVHRG